MAARLMMKFPNAVTCEETTRSKSSLPNSELTLTPPVTLKGISKPENIYNVSLEMYLIRLLLLQYSHAVFSYHPENRLYITTLICTCQLTIKI